MSERLSDTPIPRTINLGTLTAELAYPLKLVLSKQLAEGEHPDLGKFTINRALGGASLFIGTELDHPDKAGSKARYVVGISLRGLMDKIFEAIQDGKQ